VGAKHCFLVMGESDTAAKPLMRRWLEGR
jgi:hypothetical protein